MKSNKGITLVSLTIYVIGLTIVISVMGLIIEYFYSNLRTNIIDIDAITEYAKFNSFFTEEINRDNIKIIECNENYVVFDNGVQYSYIEENQGIYRNLTKVCSGVEFCNFSESIQKGKTIIEVNLKIKDELKTIKYAIRDW